MHMLLFFFINADALYQSLHFLYLYLCWFCQGRINHCAGCTIGGAPDQLQIFHHAVLTYERSVGLNVTTTTKKRSSTFGGKKKIARPKKILATHMRKGPRLTLGCPPPEWSIRPWVFFACLCVIGVLLYLWYE